MIAADTNDILTFKCSSCAAEVVIDTSKPVEERILSFIEQIGNPYLFKVGNTPVKVCYKDDGPTLQKCLETLLTQCR